MKTVLAVEVDDGVYFEPDRLTTEIIREQDIYAGVRMTVPARLHRAHHPLRIDINVGDPVTPEPVEVQYPSLLGAPFPVVGYPIETVLAEKIVTMIDRGDATTRERDSADVALLIQHHEIDGSGLAAAVNATSAHRRSELRPLRDVLINQGRDRQADWARFIKRSGIENALPESYEETIAAVVGFADPLLRGEAQACRWTPELQRWQGPEAPTPPLHAQVWRVARSAQRASGRSTDQVDDYRHGDESENRRRHA